MRDPNGEIEAQPNLLSTCSTNKTCVHVFKLYVQLSLVQQTLYSNM